MKSNCYICGDDCGACCRSASLRKKRQAKNKERKNPNQGKGRRE